MTSPSAIIETIDTAGRLADDVRVELQQKLRDGTALICPCCDQHVFLNSRRITHTMARQLKYLATHGPADSKTLQQSTSGRERLYALLRFWDLIQKAGEEGDMWQITETGLAFVRGEITVAKYAYVYNNTCMALSPEQVTFEQAAKTPFSLPEVFETQERIATAVFV